MAPTKADRLISSIYDAAVDERLLREALITLADVTGCRAAALEVYTPCSSQYQAGRNPLIDPEHAVSYFDYWRRHLPARRTTERFGLGRVLRSADIYERENVVGSAFFNEWLRPQGLGGDGRYANVAANGRATVVLGAFKPFRQPEFRPEEQHLFGTATRHFVRAMRIRHRLSMAEAQQSAALAGQAPVGFVIVDRDGRVLASHAPSHLALCSAGFLSSSGEEGRIEAHPVRRLVSGAGGNAGPRAGQVELRGGDGTLLRITVIPLAQSEAPYNPWLFVDRPAALLHVARPEDEVRDRTARIAARHGLTPAEAAVAIEAAKGDGRAAVAVRLGIRETTVRSHLSAVFDKLGIHRQAELARIVAEG